MPKHKTILSILITILIFITISLSACSANNEHTHYYSNEWAYDATYHWYDSACGHKLDPIAKAAHNFGNGEKCTVCQYKRPHKHTLSLIKSKTATCTQPGNIAYYKCSGCEQYFSDKNGKSAISKNSITIKEIGHKFEEWKTVQEATCTKNKIVRRICKNCNEEETEITQSSGHKYENKVCLKCGEKQPTSGVYYGYSGSDKTSVCVWKFVKEETTDTDIVICNYYGDLPVVAIYSEVFKWKTEITSVTIPGNVIYIGEQCFLGCNNLTTVYLSEGLQQIHDNAFDGCSSLSNVIIPDGVTYIGEYAFYKCSNLTNITVPNSIKSIEANTFSFCDKLTCVYFNGTEEEWKNVTVKSGNYPLEVAEIYFYSNSAPVKDGKFWHYEEGTPTIWKT